MNIQHSSRTDAWRTPDIALDLVRNVLIRIDLDPASDSQAQKRVKAKDYINEYEDALEVMWPDLCSVYLNPPGGKLNGKSKVRLFWQALMRYRARRALEHAIFACFSVEALQTTQGDHPCAMDFPFCVPAKRIRWIHPILEKVSPSHSNAFIYVPGRANQTSRFMDEFSMLGKCVHPK